MPTILLRADAEKAIGIGDLMSLIYLAGEFQRQSWRCFFVVKDYLPALQIIRKQKVNNVFLIPHNMTIKDEIGYLKTICQNNNVDCLLMEITGRSLLEYSELGKPVPIKACVNFDGLITSDFDIVINWCVGSSDNLYDRYKTNNTQFIYGFENTVLPDYFNWKEISARAHDKKIEKILISMGGIDEFNLTLKIVQALSQLPSSYEIRIVIGPGYEYRKNLSEFMEAKFRSFIIKQNPDNLFKDYMWADIAFSAGGLTASELVAAKTPAILISTHKHQIKRCEYYSRNKWSHYAGYYANLNEKSIIDSLRYLINNIELFRKTLVHADFRGGNEKIYESICACRQSKELV